MAAILALKKSVETKIATLGLPVAYENVNFTPAADQDYLIVQFMNLQPDDPVIGRGYYRERIQVQVFVCSKLGVGTTPALTKAEEVRALFPKGFSETSGTYEIYTFETPQVKSAVKTVDRIVIPVIFDFAVGVLTL